MFAHKDLQDDYDNMNKAAMSQEKKCIARIIDSTLLKMDFNFEKIIELCNDAKSYSFRSVCIPPSSVLYTSNYLKKIQCEDVKVCTVVGFPNGYSSPKTKISEVQNAISDGANEIDFVQNILLVKNALWSELEEETRGIVNAAYPKLVKVILETSLLSDEEIYKCSLIHAKAGVHVIKTSTGFGQRGATLNDINIIKKSLMEHEKKTNIILGIKASGGVRNFQDAISMLKAGATRLGTSGGVAIINGCNNNSNY